MKARRQSIPRCPCLCQQTTAVIRPENDMNAGGRDGGRRLGSSYSCMAAAGATWTANNFYINSAVGQRYAQTAAPSRADRTRARPLAGRRRRRLRLHRAIRTLNCDRSILHETCCCCWNDNGPARQPCSLPAPARRLALCADGCARGAWLAIGPVSFSRLQFACL